MAGQAVMQTAQTYEFLATPLPLWTPTHRLRTLRTLRTGERAGEVVLGQRPVLDVGALDGRLGLMFMSAFLVVSSGWW